MQDDTPVTPFPPIGCSGNPGTCPSAATGSRATTTYEYDSRGRKIRQKQAQGTSDEAITEWDYDLAGNNTEIRHPCYFDSNDSAYQKAKTTTTYNGRNLPISTTGLSVSKLGGGTYNISIAAVISKVADTPANGGAGVVFANGSDGAVSDCMS